MSYLKKILLTNDDGIQAPGITHLAEELVKNSSYDVRVSAPNTQNSGLSHAITCYKPVFVSDFIFSVSSVRAISVEGTPADCVNVVVAGGEFGDWVPDLVISGINEGANAGAMNTHSGTVGGAKEGCVHGIPAIATSIKHRAGCSEFLWNEAASMTSQVVEKLFQSDHFHSFRHFVININHPNINQSDIPGWKVTEQGYTRFRVSYQLNKHTEEESKTVEQKKRRKYYRVPFWNWENHTSDDFEVESLEKGYKTISLLPLTYHDGKYSSLMEEVRNWNLK